MAGKSKSPCHWVVYQQNKGRRVTKAATADTRVREGKEKKRKRRKGRKKKKKTPSGSLDKGMYVLVTKFGLGEVAQQQSLRYHPVTDRPERSDEENTLCRKRRKANLTWRAKYWCLVPTPDSCSQRH